VRALGSLTAEFGLPFARLCFEQRERVDHDNGSLPVGQVPALQGE